MLILSYENEFNLHVKEISFSYERMSTKTRFEEEAKGNSEMACFIPSGKPCATLTLVANNVTSGRTREEGARFKLSPHWSVSHCFQFVVDG